MTIFWMKKCPPEGREKRRNYVEKYFSLKFRKDRATVDLFNFSFQMFPGGTNEESKAFGSMN